ncbi:hypothetical protein BN1708_006873 [Verticillium longisporum]|uniref:GA4 desaturase n=1 Tax=Verticillium longisporum TaxID=100787 RepID=A0A0G4MNY8_VERLO|nr:hypothetical protein BN1708_006873 [Verticillium longisporum]
MIAAVAVQAGQSRPATALTKAKLRYVAEGHTPQPSPHNFHLPDITEFGDTRFLPLHSVRPVAPLDELTTSSSNVSLRAHGFTAIRRPTALHAPPHCSLSFRDPELLKQHVIPDTELALKQLTGCTTVVTEALLLRCALWSATDSLAAHGSAGDKASELKTGFPQFIGFDPISGGGSPASKIHLDYSPDGARMHIRSYKHSGGPRWALYSTWRPLKTVRRDPLAVLDYTTFKEDDYVPAAVPTPSLGREGVCETHPAECYLARYSKQHKWYWIDNQIPEECLVLRFFDSDEERAGSIAAGGVLHSSAELEGNDDAEPRESLEIRSLCIW